MIKKNLSTIFSLIFIGVFAVYCFVNLESFKPLLNVSLAALFIIAFTKMMIYFANGLFLQWTVEVFVGKMRYIEGLYIAILSAIGNFFGPLLGGATIRAVYLKKVHKLSYSFFTSTLAGYYVILFAANSLIAIISLLFLREAKYSTALLLFFASWFAAMLALMVFNLPQRKRFARLERRKLSRFIFTVLYDVENGWRQITSKKGLVPKLSLLAMVGFIVTFIVSYTEFRVIGANISVAGLGFYTAVSITALLISITPGAIGIRESLLLLTSSVMGVTNDQILQVAVIDRGVTLIMLGLLYTATYFIKPKVVEEP